MKRVNFVTLGVHDLAKSKQFFLKMFGWKPKDEKHDDIAFYDMGGWLLALYPWKLLAEDVTVPGDGNGFRGVTLAHNVSSKAEVAEVLKKAQDVGGSIVKPATDAAWGGHSGYFQDLDGHYWEVAWNPFIPLLDDGTLDVKSG